MERPDPDCALRVTLGDKVRRGIDGVVPWCRPPLEKPRSALHAGAMVAGWKFLGEFKRGRRESLSLECIVALRDRNEAEEIARKKLVGADKITAVELSRAQLVVLNIIQGDVRL